MMMSELGLQDMINVPGLPGDFQPLDYDDTDCEEVASSRRTPFSDVTNMSSGISKTENSGVRKPFEIFTKLTEEQLGSMKTCEIGKVKPPSQTDTSHIIECHEEVVSLKEHSETNQTETVNFLSPRSKAISRASVHLPPVTPTKPGGDHLDPLTPTTNLKMLISAASPEIRNLEKRQQCEKKERLFHAMLAVTSDDLLTHQVEIKTTKSRPTASTVASEGNEQENVKENSRKAKSLGLLCERFLEMYQDSGGSNQEPCEMSLDVIAKDLSVERRRIYDIINVLESVEMVSRKAKNRYIWHGQCNLTETLKKLKFLGAKYNYGDQLVKLKGLEKTRVVGQKGTCSNVPVASETLPKQFNSEEEGKKEKSLGVMSQKFIMLFLQPLQNKIISLETAARVLYGELSEDITDNPKFKTKVRRLYDIANILGSLKLIRKVYVQEVRGRKPAFEWIGPDPDIQGFEPTNLHCLLNSQEKKSSGFSEGEGGRRKNKRRNQKSGWVRHHSCNVLNQRATMEPKAPLSLPNSPEKQPPTPITDSSEFQLELAALYSRYPGQMHQFLTTPPAGSISSPSTARKLLLPSPSPSQPCGQEVSPSPSSAPSLMPPNRGYVEGHQTLPILDGTAAGTRGSKTIFVQRFVPVLTPNTLLQVQAQMSPPCGTITTAGNHLSSVSIAASSNGLPVSDLPIITQTTCGESIVGTTLYPSSCVASPIMAITHGQKRSLDVDLSTDNEYQAVMKQLKVSHQPGSLISTQSTPSGESSLGYTPPSSGSPLQNNLQTSTIQASNARHLPWVEKSNGWYDPISETPPSHMTKKRNKRSRKHIHRTRERKIRSKGTSPKNGSTDMKEQDENNFVEHIRPKAVTPRLTGSWTASNLECPRETTPSSSKQENDSNNKQRRQLFQAHKHGKTSQAKTKKKRWLPSLSPSELSDHSPPRSPPRDTPTPASSLKSSFGSQEFDQMLRNNVGSPLISFLHCHPQETTPLNHSPCSLPTFTNHAQPGQLTVLPSPTPLTPQTTVTTSINLTMVPSLSVPQLTSYMPLVSLSVPISVQPDTVLTGLLQDPDPKMTHPSPVTNNAIGNGGKADSLHTTAFQIVPQT